MKHPKLELIALALLAGLATGFNLQGRPVGDPRLHQRNKPHEG